MSEGSKRVKESVGGKRANSRILESFWGVLGQGAELHLASMIFSFLSLLSTSESTHFLLFSL